MVNRSLHESDSGSGHESWRDADTGAQLRSDDSTRKAAAARREISKELAEAVPALHSISRQKPVMPSAAQWSAFSKELSEKLEQESKVSALSRWRGSLQDRLFATDSKRLRMAFVTSVAAAIATILAVLLYIASQIIPAPAPATALRSGDHYEMRMTNSEWWSSPKAQTVSHTVSGQNSFLTGDVTPPIRNS